MANEQPQNQQIMEHSLNWATPYGKEEKDKKNLI